MNHGFRNGFLRLAHWSRRVAGTEWMSGQKRGYPDAEARAEHELRDLGILDGRVSPSSVKHDRRAKEGGLVEALPRWL